MSTGERPLTDILQDRRYWVIHVLTIPSLFISGCIFIISGLGYKIFGSPRPSEYLSSDSSVIRVSVINDRFSALSDLSDI